eukprot:TRINITY_DN3944_c0_g1_i1.p1 TRINITY_DN3944_c0_g1~~TRINITY_DN3944_c0_g1_i1.p1  ORF type:complete len:211 (-),score=78.12 TRINITY_DN3944_c0_g1_i1:337-969(-)
MIRRPPRSTQSRSSAASDVYKRQGRHVAVLRFCGNQYWDVRVVGTAPSSPLTSCVVNRLHTELEDAEGDRTLRETTSQLEGAKQELQKKREEIQRAGEELSRISQQVEIKQSELSKLSSQEVPHLEGLAVEECIEVLAKQIEKVETDLRSDTRNSLYCSICCEKPFVWVFPCGHAKCDACAERLVKEARGCPECRKPLSDPRRLFWAGVG